MPPSDLLILVQGGKSNLIKGYAKGRLISLETSISSQLQWRTENNKFVTLFEPVRAFEGSLLPTSSTEIDRIHYYSSLRRLLTLIANGW